MPMFRSEPLRYSKYVTVVAIENAATMRRKEKTNMTIRFFDALIWFFEMNQAGNARIMSSVITSRAVINTHLATYIDRQQKTSILVSMYVRFHRKLHQLQER